MNRREFFKTSGASIATIALFPAIGGIAEPAKPIKRNKEYWKQHFRATTQEANLVDMVKQYPKEQAMEKYAELLSKRFSEETYVQMRFAHTDFQIDHLPNKSGAYNVFRMQYGSSRKKLVTSDLFVSDIPEIGIELVSTPILLEV